MSGPGEQPRNESEEAAEAARAEAHQVEAEATSAQSGAPKAPAGGEVRRLDRAPGERYRAAAPAPKPGPSRRRRLGAAMGAALGTAVVTFVLITVDIGPGLLVIGLAGGWVTGLALAGGARAGRGDDAGPGRAATAAVLAAAGVSLGLLLDALRAYALGGVLLPWEYALARFGWVAPAAIVLAAVAGALRGR
jgi:hypothetical protein